MVPHEGENPNMVLLKAERAQAALVAANDAIEHAEVVFVRLNQSLSLLRARRDELARKLESDLDRAANHPDATPVAIPVPPAPLVRWSYF
jgi:hypothetical protein